MEKQISMTLLKNRKRTDKFKYSFIYTVVWHCTPAAVNGNSYQALVEHQYSNFRILEYSLFSFVCHMYNHSALCTVTVLSHSLSYAYIEAMELLYRAHRHAVAVCYCFGID